MPQEDYYEILEISETASDDEIRKAYRRLAKKYHPDRNKGDKAAERKFKEITKANETLSDKSKRAEYDRFRKMGNAGFGGMGFEQATKYGFNTGGAGQQAAAKSGDMGGGLGDLFKDFFDFGKTARPQQFRPQKGQDVYMRLDIGFDTSIRGGKTRISLPVEEVCDHCKGSGAEPGSKTVKCPECGGKGVVESAQGGFAFSRPCPNCYGRGKIVKKPCRQCRGSGMVRRKKQISVKIPRGIENGAKIRIKAMGNPGVSGGKRGDLILRIRVLPHKSFKRKGLDIHSEISIDFVSAILGTKLFIDTLDGKMKMSIPSGTQPGTKLRLRERGVTTDKARGDHYVIVNIHLPKKITNKHRHLLEELAKLGVD